MKYSALFKWMALCCFLLALLLSAVACAPEKPQEESTTPPKNDIETTTLDAPDTDEQPVTTPLTLIRSDGTSDYKIYYPADVASTSKEILRAFADSLQEKTDCKKIPVYKITANASNDFEITFNLSRERADAAASYFATAITDYELRVNGNRIIVTAFSNEALTYLLDGMLNALTQDSAGQRRQLGAASRRSAKERQDDCNRNGGRYGAFGALSE